MNAFRELGTEEMMATAGGDGWLDGLFSLIRSALADLYPDIKADLEQAIRDLIGSWNTDSSSSST